MIKTIVSIALILFIGTIAYFPSLDNGFVNWDDNLYVIENETIQNLSWENVKKIFSFLFVSNYQPLTMITYLFEYRLVKLNPFVYHLTNLIFHLLNSLLIFWLTRTLTKKISVSLIVAIFFMLHPLNVETVAWISERKNVVYGFFFLSAIICYCHYLRKSEKRGYYYFSLILFLLSLLSKAMAITLPLVLFLIDYFFYRKVDRNAIIEKIPFFILAFIFSAIAIWSHHETEALRLESEFNIFNKVGMSVFSIIFYLNKILMPVKLSCLYPYFKTGKIATNLYFLIILSILGVGVGLSAKFTRKIMFGALFFLITILPVLQFIPFGRTVVADRYVYISSFGLFYIISEGIVWLSARRLRYIWLIRRLLFIVLILIISILGFLTWNRTKAWKNSITLWSDVLKNYPNTALAYNSRGVAYASRGDLDRAIIDFDKAIETDGDYKKAYFNRAKTYSKKGNLKQAISDLTKVLEFTPYDIKIYGMRGFLYLRQGEYDKAQQDFRKIEKLKQRTNMNF